MSFPFSFLILILIVPSTLENLESFSFFLKSFKTKLLLFFFNQSSFTSFIFSFIFSYMLIVLLHKTTLALAIHIATLHTDTHFI